VGLLKIKNKGGYIVRGKKYDKTRLYEVYKSGKLAFVEENKGKLMTRLNMNWYMVTKLIENPGYHDSIEIVAVDLATKELMPEHFTKRAKDGLLRKFLNEIEKQEAPAPKKPKYEKMQYSGSHGFVWKTSEGRL
jgi:hypothetical protein